MIPTLAQKLADAERIHICDLLTITKGRVADAAKLAGVHRVQFWRKVAYYGIKPKEFAPQIEPRAEQKVAWLGSELASQG